MAFQAETRGYFTAKQLEVIELYLNKLKLNKEERLYLQKGEYFLSQGNFDKALIEFQAAQIAARVCNCTTTAPASLIQKAIKGIQNQKEEAIQKIKYNTSTSLTTKICHSIQKITNQHLSQKRKAL